MKTLVAFLLVASLPAGVPSVDGAGDRFAAVDRSVEESMAESGVLDTGDVLAVGVIDTVGEVLNWPWTGWSTPPWAVLFGVGVVTVVITWAARFVSSKRHRPA